MKRFLFFTLLFCCFASPVFAVQEIKFALLAPEGSTWAKLIYEWNATLQKETQGRLALKIYAGGVLGDERDVIRKMRIGQVHAGAFTSLGLGFINPATRILDLPFMFQNYQEVDAVAQKIQPKLESGFGEKGFVLLAWTETGFVNIFSTAPIKARSDMKGKKMWAWEGDPLVDALYKRFKIVPVPLALPDVHQALQTKLIDAVYGPPVGVIAMQWFTRAEYITDLKVANSTGGIMITKQAYAKLSKGDQEILKRTARTYARKIVEETRKENEISYTTLQKSGLKMAEVPPEEVKEIQATSVQVWDDLVGKLYPQALLGEVKQHLATYRTTHH